MARVPTEVTPLEKRARRLRRAYLFAFSLFLCITLLGLAYVGFLATRVQPAMMVVPNESPDGILIFDLDSAARAMERSVTGGNKKIPTIFEKDYKSFRGSLGQKGQVLFWKRAQDAEQWMVFIPIVRPNRYAIERLRNAVEQSHAFAPVAGVRTDARPSLGYFLVSPEGVYLSSIPEFPPHSLKEFPSKIVKNASTYSTDTGYVPRLLRAKVESAITGKAALREIQWRHGAAKKDENVSVIATGGGDREIAYFDPFVDLPAEP